MSAKLFVALLVIASISSAIAQQGPGGAWPGAGGVNPWIPSWLALQPWYPQWSTCTTIGASCVDCKTRQVCTKIGAIQKACTDPTLPYCNLGECSATPTAECAPATDTVA